MRLLLIAFTLMVGAVAAAAAPLPRSVLIVTQSSPASGGAIALFEAFSSGQGADSAERIAVYTEHLDLNRFPAPQHRQLTRDFLKEKYRDTPIGVVVVDGPIALDLVLSWRGEMWSDVPVVFSGVDEVTAEHLKLPANVTGFVVHRTLRSMVDAARLLVPGLKRVVLVGDPPERDAYRRNYRQEIAALAAEVEFTDLTGLAVTEVERRIAALPKDTAVLYTAIFVDGAGVVHTPQSALQAISGATSRPIVIDTDTQLGYGAVGGFVVSLTAAAQQAARLAKRILAGESASQIPVAKIDINKPIFDGRELKRWNINEDRLPTGSDIRFREFSAWDQYRWQIVAIITALLFQFAMISGLLVERHRRRSAELESRRRLVEVAHLNRTAAIGAMSASIAHELNQPLSAIMANAEAAENLLATNTPDLEELREVVADIRQDDRRAADIIEGIRRMLKRTDVKPQDVDINEVVRDTLHILHAEAANRGIAFRTALVANALPVRADQVQLQQVLVNLAINGMDAMADCAPGRRILAFETASTHDDKVEVSIADFGTGIPPDKLKEIFNTFYTTKQQGTGLGLSIARTIVQLHGGTIWAENRQGAGAVIRLTLPLSSAPGR